MKPIYFVLLLSSIFILACGKRKDVKAVIFERKILPDNRLLIHYRYIAGHKWYVDSTTIENHILPGDSIKVIIDPQNPSKGLPDLTFMK